MYLTLSVSSIEYAQSISRELWLLIRPLDISSGEVSQYYTSFYAHPKGKQVAVYIPDEDMQIHSQADALPLVELISEALNKSEKKRVTDAINNAKGDTLNILTMIKGLKSLSPKLKTKAQFEAAGWFLEQ